MAADFLKGVKGVTPGDGDAAYLLALVNAHAADDGDAVDALLALAAPPPGDDR